MSKLRDVSDVPGVREYLRRIGAEPTSMLRAVRKEMHGRYWRDKVSINFSRTKPGSIYIRVDGDEPVEDYLPTDEEAEEIKAGFLSIELPTVVAVPRNQLPSFNPPVKGGIDREGIYMFEDKDGDIRMMQVRMTDPDTGEKRYVPLTYWSDKEWRWSEPEGKLPLWGLDQLRSSGGGMNTVFLHEGASSAEKLLNSGKLDSHPWHRELSGAVHLGWIGGAMNPERTDWSPLSTHSVGNIYIVPDNDTHGYEAIRKIVMRMPPDCVVLTISWGDSWPIGFDLGDDFPENMYKSGVYCGPLFRDTLGPATWATKEKERGQAKKGGKRTGPKAYECTPGFLRTWQYVGKTQEAVCLEIPHLMLGPSKFNDYVSHYSHVSSTWKHLVRDQAIRANSIVYRPDLGSQRMVSTPEGASVNVYVPPRVEPIRGDITRWIDFMEMMVPDEEERHHLLRWCATLIAKPEVRMMWAVLLTSEIHGLGKSTLGSVVLSPLVGQWNTSVVSESDLTSDFNVWQAYKRLAIVEEIYSGQGWKMYNRLKSAITEMEITINVKHRSQHKCDNWVHIFACSNSSVPVKMDIEDRRWYYPRMAEVIRWTREDYATFRDWISGGGLNAIAWWANEEWDDYVLPGERAPMTSSKERLMADSIAEERVAAMRIVGRLAERQEPGAIFLHDLKRRAARMVGKSKTLIADSRFMKDINETEAIREGSIKWHHSWRPGGYRWKGKEAWVLCNAVASDHSEELVRELAERCEGWVENM